MSKRKPAPPVVWDIEAEEVYTPTPTPEPRTILIDPKTFASYDYFDGEAVTLIQKTGMQDKNGVWHLNFPKVPGTDLHGFAAFVLANHDPEKVRKWGEALVSRNFRQTTGALHRTRKEGDGLNDAPAGYCCLGVGAKVFGFKSRMEGPFETFKVRGKFEDSMVPTFEFLGGNNDDYYYPEFADMNDGCGATLTQIGRFVLAAVPYIENLQAKKK